MSMMQKRVVALITLVLTPPLSAAIAIAAVPTFQEEETVANFLDRYGLATVLVLFALLFIWRLWWPHHEKQVERRQIRDDREAEQRIAQEAAQTQALLAISAALQNVQQLQSQEAENVAHISRAIQETAVSAKASADVLASQLTYLQDLNRYILDTRRKKDA